MILPDFWQPRCYLCDGDGRLTWRIERWSLMWFERLLNMSARGALVQTDVPLEVTGRKDNGKPRRPWDYGYQRDCEVGERSRVWSWWLCTVMCYCSCVSFTILQFSSVPKRCFFNILRRKIYYWKFKKRLEVFDFNYFSRTLIPIYFSFYSIREPCLNKTA